jgi:choline-glycine betaine transporter
MILTSGSICNITALQIATASLATPKSVMNTIVFAGFVSWANEAMLKKKNNNEKAVRRFRARICRSL